jgi:outer membrane lipoprotein-sorting protein
MIASRGVVLLAFCLSLSACIKPAVRPYAPPSAEQLLASLRERAEKVRSLRATAKIDDMAKGGQRVRVKVALLVARGGKLRFEADSPLGGSLATLTSDGTQFSLLDVRANRFLTGPAKACNVARLIRLNISPEDVGAVLMGSAPLPPDARIKSAGWDADHGGREVLTLALSDGGEEIIQMDALNKTWDVRRAERRDSAGKVLWRVTNDGFKDRDGGVRSPETSDVEEPPHGADAEIKFRNVEVNVELPDELFRLPPPSNLTPEPADC